jgi:hypothetical protein
MRNNFFLFLLFLTGSINIFPFPVDTPDSLGNRIPDFSYCGYRASDIPIPEIAVKLWIPVLQGDATSAIQSAIDRLARLPLDANGFRGAVLLQSGDYFVSGILRINASGIVLRGSGTSPSGTRLIAAGKDRRTLICIEGKEDRKPASDTLSVADDYLPAGAMELNLKGKHPLKVGDKITILRPSVKEWIDILGTGHFGGGITALGWKPNEHDICWDRTIISVEGNKIGFDAPITTALDK